MTTSHPLKTGRLWETTVPDDVAYARKLVDDFTRDGRTIAVAESLTGGLLASTIVSAPGASACLRGAVVAYATDTKASILGVSQGQLDATGPVDVEVAKQMASGVAELFSADIGISTTGVAGPEPVDGHEAGTVFMGMHVLGTTTGALFHFDGDRETVRQKAVLEALRWVSESLTSHGEL